MTCDKKDYDCLPHVDKNAVKAIIIAKGKIGLIHFKNDNIYDFPGGGIENGETVNEALIREIKEEAGAVVKPSSIKAFEPGKYLMIYKDNRSNEIIKRYFNYYFCEIEDEYAAPQLTEHETETGQQFVFIPMDEALSANELYLQQGLHWVENPTYILRLLKNIITTTKGDLYAAP